MCQRTSCWQAGRKLSIGLTRLNSIQIHRRRPPIQAEYGDADARSRLKVGLQNFLDDLPAPETLDPVIDSLILADITTTKQSLQHLESLEPKPKRP
jgi:hypothetical protein